MEDKETPRIHKYGESKTLELWWQLYLSSLPERDVRNIRPLDFCWTECTTNFNIQKFSILPTVHLCFAWISEQNDNFSIQQWLIGFYNRGRECLLHGTSWAFKLDRYSFFLKGLSITEYFRVNRSVPRNGETFHLINFILILRLWQLFLQIK